MVAIPPRQGEVAAFRLTEGEVGVKLSGTARSVRNSKRLRREMSLPEVLLWNVLRGKPGGVRFRRQHPAGPYSLDFYCAAARVAIEVDGEIHSRGDRPRRDVVRDEWLAGQGVFVLRVPARDVLDDLDTVLTYIITTVGARGEAPSTTRFASGPPPPVPGEE